MLVLTRLTQDIILTVSLIWNWALQKQLFGTKSALDFKVLSQETEGGKELSVDESEYLMALFGTFPVDSET